MSIDIAAIIDYCPNQCLDTLYIKRYLINQYEVMIPLNRVWMARPILKGVWNTPAKKVSGDQVLTSQPAASMERLLNLVPESAQLMMTALQFT